MSITESACSHCGAILKQGRDHYTRRIAIVDRDRDCVVAFRCPDCETEEPRSLAEVLSVADPSAHQ
jgi:hypothetical protein